MSVEAPGVVSGTEVDSFGVEAGTVFSDDWSIKIVVES